MNSRQRKKKAHKERVERRRARQTQKAIAFGEMFSVGPFRMSGSKENIQQIPRTAFIGVDYGVMESRLVLSVFPGRDGIGPDIEVLESSHLKRSELARKLGIPDDKFDPFAISRHVGGRKS